MTIGSSKAIENAKALDYPMKDEGSLKVLEAPGGYKYLLSEKCSSDKAGIEFLICW